MQNSDQKPTFIWHPSKILNVSEYKPTQVYGFCKTSDNLVCLVRDKDEERFTLPGGGIDEGENPEESLVREFKEEAQEFVPEKDGWETVERIWVYYKDLPKYLKWIKYESGQGVYKDFCNIIEASKTSIS